MFISSFSAYCLDIPRRRPPPVSDHFVVHQGWSLTRELTLLFCHAVAYEGFDCILWNMEGWKLSLSIGVDSGIFTCIEGSTPHRAWGQGGWVADRPPATRWGRGVHTKTAQWGLKKRGNAPPRDNTTNTHNRKNGGNIYTTLGIVGYLLLWKYFGLFTLLRIVEQFVFLFLARYFPRFPGFPLVRARVFQSNSFIFRLQD